MPKSFVKTVQSEIRHMLPFHAFVLVYTAIVLAFAAGEGVLTGAAYDLCVSRFSPLYFLVLPATLAITHLVLRLLRVRKVAENASQQTAAERLGRFAGAGVTLVVLMVFMGSFTTFKTLMPILMDGFQQDRVQADLDALLHGGVDPGPALLGLINQPMLLKVLQVNYAVVWMALTFVPPFFIAVKPEARGLRLRYFLSFALVWTVLGSVIACLFLSAGPVFYAEVTGDAARFHTLSAALGSVGDWPFRAYLWQSYLDGTVGLGTGISAFPSVHVGAAMMNALFLRDINRFAGLIGFAYVGLIGVSSVLLGWHYAIDGYVSVIVVWLLHFALKRLFEARREENAALMPSPSPATP